MPKPKKPKTPPVKDVPGPVLNEDPVSSANSLPDYAIPEIASDFKNLLFLCWKALGLKEPAPIQYDVADWLQDFSVPRKQVRGMRGLGKSWMTAALIVWLLYKHPNKTIMVIGAAAPLAQDLVGLSRKLIDVLPFCAVLQPGEADKDGATQFVVRARTIPQKDPSVWSCGITSSKTGHHADFIIIDDAESLENSDTVEKRDKLKIRCEELEDIVNPGGFIWYLNTPQTEDSTYVKLEKKGYVPKRWPSRFTDPDDAQESKWVSEWLLAQVRSGKKKYWEPTYPERFPEEALLDIEAKYGTQRYMLQRQCDPRLADKERYPLKLGGFMVLPLHPEIAPRRVVWGTSDPVQDIESVGFDTDKFYKPILWDKDNYEPYEHGVMFVDPAGGGDNGDEVAWYVTKILNGTLFVLDGGGLSGGPSSYNMRTLAEKAKMYALKTVLVEQNYGHGMFSKLLSPVMADINGPTEIKDIPSGNKQKELRIIDTLQPLLASHSIVIDPKVARDQVLMTQLCKITRVRGALTHDDRVEALAASCAYFVDMLPAVSNEMQEKRATDSANKDVVAQFFKTLHKQNGSMVVHGGLIDGVTPPRQSRSRALDRWAKRGNGSW